MVVGEKQVAAFVVRARPPGADVILANRHHRRGEGQLGADVFIARENGAGDGLVGFEADEVAEVPVVKLVEVEAQGGLTQQIRRTGEQFRRVEFGRERTEVLEREIKIPLHLVAEGDEFLRAAGVGGDLRRKFPAVIVREQVGGEAELLEVVDALHLFGARLGLADGRQQQRRQDADDPNDHQQLNQSERSSAATGLRRVHAAENLAAPMPRGYPRKSAGGKMKPA